MRVALYIPPIPDENTIPALGPLYLIAVLEQNGFEGRLFDARLDKHAFSELLAFSPNIVGVSAVTAGYLDGLKAATLIKKLFPNCFVVFGGAHPTTLPKNVVTEPSVDFVLIGESETTFLNLCRRLSEREISPKSLHEVKNLAFKVDHEVVLTEKNLSISPKDMDSLPWPAFHRMDINTYFASTQTHGLFKRGRRVLPIMSSRGCPYSCTFCCRVMGKEIRCRNIESVMSEICFLVDTYKIDEIYFEDDNFTVQRDRALEILRRLTLFKPPIHVKFANGIRADLVDNEILTMMKAARVYSISFGIETGCQATLQRMKKGLNLDKARENILLAKSMGFLVGANCIIGYPGETVQDIMESFDYFFSLPLDSMAIVNLVPYPGTEVRKICEENGYLTKEAQDWNNYFFSLNKPIPLSLTKEQLVKLVHNAYYRMYCRPRWMLTALKHLSFRQLYKGTAMMFGLGNFRREQGIK